MKLPLAIGALLVWLPVLRSATPSDPKPAAAVGQRRLATFDYKGVALEGGPLRRQFDEVREYYLRIPNDDLLKGFRARAGLPAPGVELGGWYTRDYYNIFGNLLSGLARMYAATGDPRCRDKLDYLVAEWARTIEPDGYFYYSRQPNSRLYTYDKMAVGLVDAYLYGGNRDALQCLSRITDWAIRNLNRGRPYSFNSNYDSPEGGTEWYILSENLYRAYGATGDPKYRDFGKYWEYTGFWDLLARRQSIFSPFDDKPFRCYHAFSHVNALSGAGAAYLVSGEPHYLEALKNGYDFIFHNQSFATGGYGPNERLMPPEDFPSTLFRMRVHFETQCGTWAVFKLGKMLVSLTGDAAYADWMERVMINGIGASIPMSPDGSVFYNSDYNIEGAAKTNTKPWSCCAGTRPMAAADFHDILYYSDAAGLYVALFAESTVDWTHDGETVRLAQQTSFPEKGQTEFRLALHRPVSFRLGVRIPGWLDNPLRMTLNGKSVDYQVENHWATIRRQWRDGDVVAVTLPMGLWLAAVPGAAKTPAAVMRGPVTMAFRSAVGNPSALVNLAQLDESLQPSPGDPLTYRVAAAPDVLMRPFYAFKADERYYMYLAPGLEQWERPWNITATPEPKSTPWFWFTSTAGAVIEYPFTGPSIRWTGFRFDDGGKAEVRIDGEVVDTVDQFGPAITPANPPVGPALPFAWSRTQLAPGRHKLTIRALSDRNPASKGYRITVARMESGW
jgi:DUF1680 family protein